MTRKKKTETQVKETKPVIVRGFKGFDLNMQCRGMQYEVGKTYEEPEASLCNKGLHFCEHPLDCFNYYDPVTSVYAEVEAETPSNETSNDDTKRVTKKLTVKGMIGISGLVQAAVDFVIERATTEEGAHATGDRGAASATGDRGAASATGDQGAASATGDRGAASATGDLGAASATGDQGAASATGDRGAASATGYHGAASATGDWGAASATGYQGAASATGDRGAASATGEESVAMASGYMGKAKASAGSWIVLAERNDDGEILTMRCAKAGEEVSADTYYRLVNGEFVEA